jgi:hypothetical protein
MGLSSDSLFFFGHPLCDFKALILFFDFVVTHNNHLIRKKRLTAKKARYPDTVSQFEVRANSNGG